LISCRSRAAAFGKWSKDINRASIKVAEDCGFPLAGNGIRVQRLKGFDYYQLTNPENGMGGAVSTRG
jgi:hypothetical protein